MAENKSYDYLYARIVGRLEIDGKDFPITSASVTYALNEIPSAQCTLAVGRSEQGASRVHQEFERLTYMAPASIYMTVVGKRSRKQSWPNKEIKLFRGFFAGPGMIKQVGALEISVTLIHWLAELSFSSMLAKEIAPGHAFDLSFPLWAGNNGSSSGAYNQESVWDLIDRHGNLQTAARKDLWDGALKPALIKIAERELIPASVAGDGGANDEAKAALEKTKGDDWLKLRGEVANNPSATIALDDMVCSTSLDSAAGHSFWQKIIGVYSPLLMFKVIPRVEDALMRPVTGLSRETFDTQIKAEEYHSIEARMAFHNRPLRGVQLYGGVYNSGSGSDESQMTNTFLLPRYMPSAKECPACAGGVMEFVQMPPWLERIGEVFGEGLSEAGSDLTNCCGALGLGSSPKEKERRRSEAMEKVGLSYARYSYAVESLKYRSAAVSGKLRFDIAPGAVVKIEGSREQFLTRDAVGTSYVAAVSRVTSTFKTEPPSAATAYELAWMRTEKENQTTRLTISQHPLYEKMYLGDPLIPELK